MKAAGRRLVPLLGLALLTACGGGGAGPTAPEIISLAEVEYRSSQLVNDARSEHGVEPRLALDASLSEIARLHSRDMRDRTFFGHENPDGRGLRQRLERAGYLFSRAAENVARVSGTPDPAGFAHDLLMETAVHRRNILDDGFSVVGVGAARHGDTVWITQIFARP